MTDAPIPLTLDLWALGHSASDIAAKLGLPSPRHVNRIIDQARDIGDPRAVLHVGKNGNPRGRRAWTDGAANVEMVPEIPAPRCIHGHLKTPDNVDRFSNCRACRRIRARR